MNQHIMYLLAGITVLSSCSRAPEQSTPSSEFSRLEKKIDLLLQQEETEEQLFLRNIKLLRNYVSTHPERYEMSEGQMVTLGESREYTKANYNNFKAWSKRTLDGFASIFVDTPGGR